MIGPMLQQLLEDRFKVKVHREMREVSGLRPGRRQGRRER